MSLISNNTINLIGWILFIISAIGFIIASIGGFWAIFGSVFFLFACLVFLIPMLPRESQLRHFKTVSDTGG